MNNYKDTKKLIEGDIIKVIGVELTIVPDRFNGGERNQWILKTEQENFYAPSRCNRWLDMNTDNAQKMINVSYKVIPVYNSKYNSKYLDISKIRE